MAYPQTLWKKSPMARVVVALPVPKPPMEVQLQERGDEPQSPHTPTLTVRQRHGKLFNELDFSGLNSWPQELADPAKFGCTHSMEHMIKVTDDTPFKE